MTLAQWKRASYAERMVWLKANVREEDGRDLNQRMTEIDSMLREGDRENRRRA